jgi:serine/threonine protein kinase
MEYCGGGDLFEYILKNKKLSEYEACKIFSQIISGLEYIHKKGIAHRDMKPENILLDYYKNVKIVDFGLSNLYKSGEMLKTSCGSLCYAAPEMILGARYDGCRADIWSCGVILYTMVCGYFPFDGANKTIIYSKIVSSDFNVPDALSNDLKDLLRNILNKNPESRISIEQMKKHIWFVARNQTITTHCETQNPIDKNILQQMNLFGLDAKQVKKNLLANLHDSLTATYKLLYSKHIRTGGKSTDLNNSITREIAQKVSNSIHVINRSVSPTVTLKEDLLTLRKRNVRANSIAASLESSMVIPTSTTPDILNTTIFNYKQTSQYPKLSKYSNFRKSSNTPTPTLTKYDKRHSKLDQIRLRDHTPASNRAGQRISPVPGVKKNLPSLYDDLNNSVRYSHSPTPIFSKPNKASRFLNKLRKRPDL